MPRRTPTVLSSFAFPPGGVTRFLCVLVFLAAIHAALGGTWTWNGNGGNVNWSTGGNWTSGTAPTSAATTDLIFAGANNTGTALVPLNQNIAAPFLLNTLTFNSGSGSFYLGGGALRFDGGSSNTITQSSSNAQSIANAINAPSSNNVVTLTLAGNGTGVVTMSGVISVGTGQRDYALVKTGTSVFSLTGTNTYAGGTTINGGTLSINSSASLGAVSGGLTINAGTLEVATGFTTSRVITLGNTASTFQIDPSQTYTVNSAIAGSGSLNKAGLGTLVLSGANSYTGATNVSAGTLQISANERIVNTSDLNVSGGTFDVQTFSETLHNVTLSSGSITGTGAGTVTASSYAMQSGTASAILAGAGATLTKTTAGTVTLSGANTFTGATTVSGGTLTLSTSSGSALGSTSSVTVNSSGTLLLGADNQINNAATMTLAGGTLALGGKSEGAAGTTGLGALTLTATSTIDFAVGSTNSIIQFAGLGTHTAGALLQITNWNGTPNIGGGTERLLFAGTTTSFTSLYAQSDVAFNGIAGYAAVQFSGYYEITAVPEPTTWLAGALALGVVGLQGARRRRAKARAI